MVSNSYKTDYIRIDNLDQFLIKELKHYHPEDPRYLPYWKRLKRMCIEGFWGKEFGQHRYCPGRLFFYGNFCIILDVNEAENTRVSMKPDIRDIEWERAYMVLEAEGFSGWTDDDEYTSDIRWFKYAEDGIPDISNLDPTNKRDIERLKSILTLVNSKGLLKKYITPRENIRKLHSRPKGLPLYYNNAKNIIELGARGGGKSYFYALAVTKYEIVFDGTKYYTEESIVKPPKAELCVGAGQKNKSAEFCNKVEDSLNELALNNELGVWGSLGDDDYTPNPFYKDMTGSIGPNNKDNLWRHEYTVLEKGREITKGTGSYLAHVVYATQKREGAEAAAGGRYTKLIYEEIGLLELLLKAWGSNNSTVKVGTKQFGCQIGLGTSGNMETILPAKTVFLNPKTYNVVSYNDDWEQTGDIGFFLPVYMTAREFKDRNGNTDFKAVIDYYEQLEAEAAKADNPHVLAIFRMNNPMRPSDMWQTDKSCILPVNEAEQVEKKLFKGKLYQRLGTPIKLTWDSSKPQGVDYKVDPNAEPFYEPKYRYTRTDLSGAIMIYEFPVYIKEEIPPDMYLFIGHDPYVSDNIDEGDSLGVTYIIMNPKYLNHGYNGNTIVASYIGKPPGGRKQYYQNLEKLIAFYGNPPRSLWFEANKGDECKNYFMNRHKTGLLALRPTKVGKTDIYAIRITQYGFIVGNKIAKIDLLDKFSDWLLEPTDIDGEVKLNIERIPCIFLIRQIALYNLKGNFDAVSAMLGCILGIREHEFELQEERAQKNKTNRLAFLSTNNKVFRGQPSARFQNLN